MIAWDQWIGSRDNEPTMFIKTLIDLFGRKVDLHKMIAADEIGCFHSHPAYAVRVVLWGGYQEELKTSGAIRAWRPGMIGLVRPQLEHRIHTLRNGRVSYSLWLRGKKRADIHFGCGA